MRKRGITVLQFTCMGIMAAFGSFIVISIITMMNYIAQMKLTG